MDFKKKKSKLKNIYFFEEKKLFLSMWKPTLGLRPRILLIFDLKCNEDRDAPLFCLRGL